MPYAKIYKRKRDGSLAANITKKHGIKGKAIRIVKL